MDGRIRLGFGDRPLGLEAGDSCHFDGLVPHAFENTGTTTARVLIAITPAAFEPDGDARPRAAAQVAQVAPAAPATMNGTLEVESIA